MLEETRIPEALSRSGGFDNRARVGERWFKYITEDAALPAKGSVLDIGCGLGRIAVPLTRYVKGRYEGFDINPAAVDWCTANITPKAPNFKFRTIDASSKLYNPLGSIAPQSVHFPYEASSFDVVFLASVFTHMLPQSVESYFREIVRVLKPGGRAVISYFLLNGAFERARASGKLPKRYFFPHESEGARIRDRGVPEKAVAHYESKIQDLYVKYGMEITEIRYGRWTGNRNSRSGQDLVIASK